MAVTCLYFTAYITSVLLDKFLHFLYQWKQEWIYYLLSVPNRLFTS